MVFAEVLEIGSFSGAAQSLGIAKSSVSKRVSALERELGVRLIQRSTRKLRVTEEGEALFQRCARIRQELDEAEREVAGFREAPRGTIRLGAPPLFASTRLAGLLPEFLSRYPDLRIELRASEKQSDLIAGGYDASLRTGELADSSLVALCAAPRYLETHGRPQHPSDVERHNYLAWQSPDRLPISQLMFRKGARSYRAKTVSNFSSTDAMSIREATVNGGGITLLPDFAIHGEVESGLLEVLLGDYDVHEIPLSIVYPQREQRPLKVRVLAEYLKDAFGSRALTT
jgi:DNA-binding transcriptional LysR family regulator